MPSLIDCRFEGLRGMGYVGSISDMLRTWLLASGADPTYKHINDLWLSMLASKGFYGQINDAWYNYLGALGYTAGHINDREAAFWCTGGGCPGYFMCLAVGTDGTTFFGYDRAAYGDLIPNEFAGIPVHSFVCNTVDGMCYGRMGVDGDLQIPTVEAITWEFTGHGPVTFNWSVANSRYEVTEQTLADYIASQNGQNVGLTPIPNEVFRPLSAHTSWGLVSQQGEPNTAWIDGNVNFDNSPEASEGFGFDTYLDVSVTAQFIYKGSGTLSAAFPLAVRLQSYGDFIGVRPYNGRLELYERTNGTFNKLGDIAFPAAANYPVTLAVAGDQVTISTTENSLTVTTTQLNPGRIGIQARSWLAGSINVTIADYVINSGTPTGIHLPMELNTEWENLTGPTSDMRIDPNGDIYTQKGPAGDKAVAFGSINAEDVHISARFEYLPAAANTSSFWLCARILDNTRYVGVRANGGFFQVYRRLAAAWMELLSVPYTPDTQADVELILVGLQGLLIIDGVYYAFDLPAVTTGRVGIVNRTTPWGPLKVISDFQASTTIPELPDGVLVTEDGDFLVTESGELLIATLPLIEPPIEWGLVPNAPSINTMAISAVGNGWLAVEVNHASASNRAYWTTDKIIWTQVNPADVTNDSGGLISPVHVTSSRVYCGGRRGSLHIFEWTSKSWVKHQMPHSSPGESTGGIFEMDSGRILISVVDTSHAADAVYYYTDDDFNNVLEGSSSATSASHYWSGVACETAGGRVIGGGRSGNLLYTDDGINWHSFHVPGIPNNISSPVRAVVALSSGTIIAIADDGYGSYSNDVNGGTATWSAVVRGFESGSITARSASAYLGIIDQLVYVTDSGYASATTDGVIFTTLERWLVVGQSPPNQFCRSVSYNSVLNEHFASWTSQYEAISPPLE